MGSEMCIRDRQSSPDGSCSHSRLRWFCCGDVTPRTIATISPAADDAQPDTARDGGFWISTGMRRLTDLGLGLVVVLFAAPRAFRGRAARGAGQVSA